MSTDANRLFVAAFPFAFAALWLASTTLLGAFSGWFTLQQRYDRGDEPPLLKLRWRSGTMGFGVHMNNILTLSACPSGLRVGVSRLFGPFQRPFLVPWSEIGVEPVKSFFALRARLHFGCPKIGSLKIDARTWQRLAAASPSAPSGDAVPVSRMSGARALALQWAAASALAGSFFYFASRQHADQPAIPAVICFAFPAAAFGVAQMIRFVRNEM
ncbi:MAG: hypothetical protein QOH81_1182 [Sphingomonadales bacterium]|jgi:hypothetical protein|nr:hypothetical protein [Sphingomonadales bacterium]